MKQQRYDEAEAAFKAALSYAETQLLEQATVVSQGGGDPLDLESRALHIGSLQFLATEAEELVKICCFDSLSVGNLSAKEMAFYPEARTPVGSSATAS